MIVGILGKGGSGKSTVSTNIVRFLESDNKNKILAVDSDHNMDLTYNLGSPEELTYFGSSLDDLRSAAGLNKNEDYRTALSKNEQGLFKLSPKDNFTSKYTKEISNNLSIMSAGPQTSDVLSDISCSHILFTSLKVFLPLLSLNENEWVIVDEKAGADGVSTGIPTGFDIALIISEPTTHGIKTAKQIAGLLDYYFVPYEFIMNKVTDKYSDINLMKELGKEPILKIKFDQSFSEFDGLNISELIKYLNSKKTSLIGKRYDRSKNKFDKKLK